MHYSTLVILPSDSTQKDVMSHLAPFKKEQPLTRELTFYFDEYEDYREYGKYWDCSWENPISFYDYFLFVPEGRRGFPSPDFSNERANEFEPFLPCSYLATTLFHHPIYAYERLSKEEKWNLPREELLKVVDIQYRTYAPYYLVGPTGLFYTSRDVPDAEWEALCLSLYTQYADGYVAWLIDVHS